MYAQTHLGYYSILSMHSADSWFIGISCMLCDILYETDSGIAHTYTTDVDLVMRQHPPRYVHTHTHPPARLVDASMF